MNEYILFMHDDVLEPTIANDENLWGQYIAELQASGQFDGGSAIGDGMVFKKNCAASSAPMTVTGYIRVRAENIDAARRFLIRNPTYEAGGTVEVRELQRT
ncbi:MAG: hypothetical protein V4488_06930 [Pseudomonadota bacterium]